MTGRPRLGFVGLGWIGLDRMKRVAKSGAAEVTALFDPDPKAVANALEVAPQARVASDMDDLVAGIDGLVIATPNALHAEQAIKGLQHGLHVFCQKPLGRDRDETERIVAAAEAADRRLGVDLSYRTTECMEAILDGIHGGEIGTLYRMDLTFHNAYGPDKAWFYDMALAGGGCLLDLGVHLVDLALAAAQDRSLLSVTGNRWSRGQTLRGPGQAEDHAVIDLDFEGLSARVACSWKAPMGCDAVIEALFLGTEGAFRLRNVDGRFRVVVAERLSGTRTERIVGPEMEGDGRAILRWADEVAAGGGFDPAAWRHVRTAQILDQALDGDGKKTAVALRDLFREVPA